VCCSVLQCVAVCCSVLQCVAVCCSVLQCVAVCCSVLQCVELYTVHNKSSQELQSVAAKCTFSHEYIVYSYVVFISCIHIYILEFVLVIRDIKADF